MKLYEWFKNEIKDKITELHRLKKTLKTTYITFKRLKINFNSHVLL